MASYPKVRGACEYCHRRKIRCILPADSSACHNCAATHTTCLFAPRAKAGRPRRATGDAPQIQPPQSADTEPADPSDAFESSEETFQLANSESEPANIHNATENTWALNVESGHTRGLHFPSQFLFPFSKPQWHDFAHLGALSAPPTPSTHEMLQGPGLPTSPVLTASTATALSGSGRPGTGNVTPSTTLSEPPGFDWNGSSGSTTPLDFDLALKLCADLDHRYRSVVESKCLLDAEAHLQALDSVCMASIKTQPSSDSASRALILAALHKALEICDVLVHACASAARNSETTMLQQLLLLRRLDIVATFARICFMRMGQGTAAKTAEEIHNSIERLLSLEYGHWAW